MADPLSDDSSVRALLAIKAYLLLFVVGKFYFV
jgi:hypothetical protein